VLLRWRQLCTGFSGQWTAREAQLKLPHPLNLILRYTYKEVKCIHLYNLSFIIARIIYLKMSGGICFVSFAFLLFDAEVIMTSLRYFVCVLLMPFTYKINIWHSIEQRTWQIHRPVACMTQNRHTCQRPTFLTHVVN